MTAGRFTDEEWSRVLSAHAAGQLIQAGTEWSDVCAEAGCIMQVALVCPRPAVAFDRDRGLAGAFDVNYRTHWTVERLIAWVDSVPR